MINHFVVKGSERVEGINGICSRPQGLQQSSRSRTSESGNRGKNLSLNHISVSSTMLIIRK